MEGGGGIQLCDFEFYLLAYEFAFEICQEGGCQYGYGDICEEERGKMSMPYNALVCLSAHGRRGLACLWEAVLGPRNRWRSWLMWREGFGSQWLLYSTPMELSRRAVRFVGEGSKEKLCSAREGLPVCGLRFQMQLVAAYAFW